MKGKPPPFQKKGGKNAPAPKGRGFPPAKAPPGRGAPPAGKKPNPFAGY